VKSAKKKASASKATRAARPAKKQAPAAKKRAAPKRPARRADFGAPIESFFIKQPPQLRAILEVLRELVSEVAPDAEASLKWGMPFYTLGGQMMCALTAHKSHVNLVLVGSSGAYADPSGRLTGNSKSGRHLKLQALDELPRAAVRGWLRTAAALARKA
jgi:hypothetical protein